MSGADSYQPVPPENAQVPAWLPVTPHLAVGAGQAKNSQPKTSQPAVVFGFPKKG
ncbi:MAG: hypothetical protein ACKOS8_11075 [Gemmataceae bacterium]